MLQVTRLVNREDQTSRVCLVYLEYELLVLLLPLGALFHSLSSTYNRVVALSFVRAVFLPILWVTDYYTVFS